MSLNSALLSDAETPASHFMTPATDMYHSSAGSDDDIEEANSGLYASSMPGSKKPLLTPPSPTTATSIEPPSSPQPWSRRKRWGVGLTTTFCFLGLTVGIVLGVVVPTIVQTSVDGSKVEFKENTVHGVNPDGQSFTLFASMDISCDGALPAKLNAADLTFSYQGTPVGYATLPPISFEAGSNTINTQVDELFTLYDETLEGWNAFAHDLIREDSVTWHISATPTVTITFPGGWTMDYPSKMEKDIVMLGLGGMKSFEITNFDVTTPSTSTHAFFSVDARLWNPSLSTVSPLGAISMENLMPRSNGDGTMTSLGFVRATNVTMEPGWNALHLEGPVIPEDVNEMNVAMSLYFTGQPVDIVARLDDVAWDDVAYPASDNKLFEAGMLKLEIPAQLKQDHANLTMHAFSNTLVGSTDLALYNPLSADLHLARLDMNVNYDSVAFARIHADTPLDIPGGNTEVAEGVRLQLNVFGPGETDIVGEITKDATTLVPVPGKDILPEDCNTLAHAEGKCEYKGWFCLGCDGNMTVQVADLELTLAYWQEENFPVCESEGTFDTTACQWQELGQPNPCMPPPRGRKEEF